MDSITFEFVTKSHYKVRRYGTMISYLKHNNSTGAWYAGTIRMTLGADELRAIADKLSELDRNA